MWAENMVSRRRISKPFMMAFLGFLTPPGLIQPKRGPSCADVQYEASVPPSRSIISIIGTPFWVIFNQVRENKTFQTPQTIPGSKNARWAAARPGRQARK